MASATTARMTTRVEREQEITVIIEASLAAPASSGFEAVTTMTTTTAMTAETAMSRSESSGSPRASTDVFDAIADSPRNTATVADTAADKRSPGESDVTDARSAGDSERLQRWADKEHDSRTQQDRITDMMDESPRTSEFGDNSTAQNGALGDRAESWQRRQAIDAAHEDGLAYYDGTTTIDGQEVQKWVMPNGSTVYFDPETETVVDVQWQSEKAKDAAMAAAHEDGDPFFEGTTTIDGELVEIWKMADGSTAYVAVDDREVVGFEWPPGEAPEYQGQVSLDGESLSLILLPNGEQVLVDENGDFVAYLDDVDLDTTVDPILGEVYAVPSGPPDYGTRYYDADTGEALMGLDTGVTDPSGNTHYQPMGEDYILVIDPDGNIVDVYPDQPDAVWSVLGILTYYDDGALTADVGLAEFTVDLGSDGGIWFSTDGLGELIGGADWVGSLEAGIAWDEEGVDVNVSAVVGGVGEFGYGFSIGDDGFDAYIDVAMDLDLGGQGIGFELHGEVGMTSDGTVYAGVDAGMSMSIPGGPDIDLDVNAYAELGPDGFEGTAGWEGKVGMFGAYLEGGEQYSLTIDDEGLTGTYEYYRGAGIEGIGSIRAGGEVQVHTDGTMKGTSATSGVFGAVADNDGDEVVFGGVYTTVDEDGASKLETRSEHLDTGVTKEDYDRHHDDDDVPADTFDGDTGTPWDHDVLGETAETSTPRGPKVRPGGPDEGADVADAPEDALEDDVTSLPTRQGGPTRDLANDIAARLLDGIGETDGDRPTSRPRFDELPDEPPSSAPDPTRRPQPNSDADREFARNLGTDDVDAVDPDPVDVDHVDVPGGLRGVSIAGHDDIVDPDGRLGGGRLVGGRQLDADDPVPSHEAGQDGLDDQLLPSDAAPETEFSDESDLVPAPQLVDTVGRAHPGGLEAVLTPEVDAMPDAGLSPSPIEHVPMFDDVVEANFEPAAPPMPMAQADDVDDTQIDLLDNDS